jgi:KaiC/GvpD/RAD55 family RecA-like ATPase
MKLIKTGIAGLDEFLTGGLPPRILLLTGTPGSGNEIFAKQIAYTRAKQNNNVTYFTVNTSFDSIKEDMNAYNWDITPLETSGNWKFKTLSKTSDLAQTITEEMKQKRTIIIDSISEVLFTRKTQEAINLLTEMSRQNKNSENFHLLLLTEGMQDPNAETAMQHFAEGVINFNTEWTTDSTKRDILIRKMKGSFIPNRKLPYSISKKGFIIETATRIS